MSRRPSWVPLARGLNAAFFLLTAAYCLLASTPFAYYQFIKPELIDWIRDLVATHVALFWLVLLITVLTLKPHLSGRMRRPIAAGYVMVFGIVGLVLLVRPLLPAVDNSARSLAIAALALVAPIWLAIFDHRAAPAPPAAAVSGRRLLAACLLTAAFVCATYSAGAPFRLREAVGLDLSMGWLAAAALWSVVEHLFVFTALFLLMMAVTGVAAVAGSTAVEYWGIVAGTAGAIGVVLHELAFTAIAFGGWASWAIAAALGAAIALAWSGIARQWSSGHGFVPGDSMEAFLAPVMGVRTPVSRLFWLLVLAIAANVTTDRVARFDWNFLFQKLAVLVVWFTAFALMYPIARAGRARASLRQLALPPLAVLAMSQGLAIVEAQLPRWLSDPRTDPEFVLDSYAAVDPTFHLVRDALRPADRRSAGFYAYLGAHSSIAAARIDPVQVDFVASPIRRSPDPKAPIFLFVIDSLRRDYVSPYNPAVTFTPALDRLAADSFVFERGFTRYGGTGLALPAIWAGGMLMHKQYVLPFDPMNSLHKLLEAEGYQRVMSMDSIANALIPRGPSLTPLDRGVRNNDLDFCRTQAGLQQILTAGAADPRPVFGYALPQNAHLAVATFQKPAPAADAYPGFHAPVAAAVERVDRCLGAFLDFLKRTHRYDESIIIVTSDHGDSLGEEGRWGHAYTVFPEVMRVPLIVHLPGRLRDQVTADLAGVALTTDITPTLYALLGHEPADLGPLYGAPLFGVRGRARPSRRGESFLLASSYGATYALLRRNGRQMYIADAVEGRDYAYDLTGGTGAGTRIRVTETMRAASVDRIRTDIGRLATQYRFFPGL